ncbi:MAG TPA: LLM class F420-dependent oxidoreductase [Chloroflexota bacterium]|nr:LLM class F420-dependent oxidoreductase [Chloroflexota bacterium]
MKLGLQVPDFTFPGGSVQLGSDLGKIARAAEDAGFASFWVMDHFFQIENVGPVDHEMLEAYSTLAYVAALTKRMRLGAMVTGVTYRYPGILAKTVTTLDVLSGGRAMLGIGAAWNEREHNGLGVPFPAVSERFERLEEALQIVLQMWSGEVRSFDGKHYHLTETLNSPEALSKPHPPILIGGSGEKKTLRLVAKYADACNLFGGDASVLTHKLDVLRRHCDDLGRDYDAIERTVIGWANLTRDGSTDSVTPAQLVDTLASLAELGIQQAIYSFGNVSNLEAIEIVASEVIPQIAG